VSKHRVVAPAVVLLCFFGFGARLNAAQTAGVAVGPQYDSTHVYVTPEDFDRFVASFVATFGGTTSKQGVFQVTPTPSQTMSQIALTPVGIVSVFGFRTPVPYPFGSERTGYLVTDLDQAVREARAAGADVVVAPFPDAIGRDAIVQWPGGITMQLYWHTTAPHYVALASVPENRIYVSPDRADAFVHSFIRFSRGKVVADEKHAAGAEIGRPEESFRRIRIQSTFGRVTVFVTDGHLPYPYGRELSGFEVSNLDETLAKAKAAGVTVLVEPRQLQDRRSAMVQFPGGFIAEIHAPLVH
jgi:predicted enzyme related to lactoylglutathione lyase